MFGVLPPQPAMFTVYPQHGWLITSLFSLFLHSPFFPSHYSGTCLINQPWPQYSAKQLVLLPAFKTFCALKLWLLIHLRSVIPLLFVFSCWLFISEQHISVILQADGLPTALDLEGRDKRQWSQLNLKLMLTDALQPLHTTLIHIVVSDQPPVFAAFN